MACHLASCQHESAAGCSLLGAPGYRPVVGPDGYTRQRPLRGTATSTAPRRTSRAVAPGRAEGVGFEPTVGMHPQRFSRPPDSATLASLLVVLAGVMLSTFGAGPPVELVTRFEAGRVAEHQPGTLADVPHQLGVELPGEPVRAAGALMPADACALQVRVACSHRTRRS